MNDTNKKEERLREQKQAAKSASTTKSYTAGEAAPMIEKEEQKIKTKETNRNQ